MSCYIFVQQKVIVKNTTLPSTSRCNGTDIKSCFGTNEHGTMHIATGQANQWKERLTCLSYAVSHWMTMRPSEAIKVVRLFFDD